MADVKMSDLDADNAIGGAEKLLALDGTTSKTIATDAMAAYAIDVLAAASAVSPATGDYLSGFRSTDERRFTLDNVAAYALGYTASTAVATLGATDVLLVVQSGTAKKTTLTALETKLWADLAGYVDGLADAASLVDADKLYVLNGATAKYCTALEVATYVTAKLWASSTAASVVTGDTFLLLHGGTTYEATVDLLADFVASDLAGTVLDISGLDAATVVSTDLLMVCQAGTSKQADVATVGEVILDLLPTHTAALDAVDSLTGDELLYLVQGGAAKKATVDTVLDLLEETGWATISTSKYTALPASGSTITFSDTGDVEVGLPVKWTDNGTDYFGIITAISANASITIAGAALPTGNSITALYVGAGEKVRQIDLLVDGYYDASIQDLLENINGSYCRWMGGKAYLVAFSATHKTADTGASQPKINVKAGGNVVGTDDSGNGIQLSTAGTWVNSGPVAVNTTYYEVDRLDALEVRCTAAGTNGDACMLSVSLTFVFK